MTVLVVDNASTGGETAAAARAAAATMSLTAEVVPGEQLEQANGAIQALRGIGLVAGFVVVSSAPIRVVGVALGRGGRRGRRGGVSSAVARLSRQPAIDAREPMVVSGADGDRPGSAR